MLLCIDSKIFELGLSPLAIATAIWMAKFGKAEVEVDMQTLALAFGISERTAKRVTKELRLHGVFSARRRGQGKCNVYTFQDTSAWVKC